MSEKDWNFEVTMLRSKGERIWIKMQSMTVYLYFVVILYAYITEGSVISGHDDTDSLSGWITQFKVNHR